MTRFIAGILVCLLAQALGWPTIERALHGVNSAVQATYEHAEQAVKDMRHGR